MRLIVTDANIFIDLQVGGLLDEMFRLRTIEFAVPDILYIEELAERHARLPGLGLKILSLDADAVADVESLREKYPLPGLNDLFALALAKSEECPLLTGDGWLRTAAKSEQVEVHGTVWLMEQIRFEQKISASRVREAYAAMRRDGSRLPWKEIENQIARWEAD